MKGALDPVTKEKIDAFARRRRSLILVRGVCAVFTILLALMSVLALLDYFVLMADELRWVLSLSAYAAALVAAWFTCARLVVRVPDPRELARLIEQVRPELREDLLSAVELGEGGKRAAWESEEFREVLQQNVAGRIRTVDIAAILSLGRIRRWLVATGAVVAACGALLFVPGLRFEHLLQRALRPMANLERISRVHVTILEPRPPEREVPQSDIVLVRIETDGPETRRVILETFPTGKKAERVEMAPAGGRKFESSIAVGREPVAYRIRAGDAITRKYTLTAVPRPDAVAFHKTYTYPAYSKKEPRKVSETTGDLTELEGTIVDLAIEVNQDVTKAELRIEQAGKSRVETLAPHKDPRRLTARVPITASGTYRVHLEAVRGGTVIENKFSPQYEIKSMPDLVPKVTLDDPRQDLLVPPLEVVGVRGTAKDDLGLKLVAQAIRVNQGEWKETPLAEDAGAQASVSRRWDLYELGVHPGDRITTKLVAVDLKGSRAESNPVHIVISAPGFDPQRHVPLVAKKMAYDALVELRDQVRAVGKKVSEAAALAASDELPRRQALLNAAQDSEKVFQKADEAEGRIKEALRLARAGRESADLVLAAILVRRLKEESIGGGRAEVEKAGVATEAVSLLKRAEASFRRATEQAQAAEEGYREILASEESIAALNDVRDLVREQQAIHKQLQDALAAKDAKAWERLARREGVAADQVATVENVLQVLALHAQEGYGKRVAVLAQQLQAAREALRKALEAVPGPALAGPSAALQNAVNAAHQQLHGLELELARRAERAEDALEKRAEPNAADVAATGREMQDLAAAQKALATDRNDARERKVKEQSDRATGRWKAARAQLEGRAGVEESRRDSDTFFVSDASLAGRAMQAVLEAHQASPDAAKTRETLAIVEKALRTLETGHRAAELSGALRALAEEERWHGAATNLSTRHPKDWRWMEERLKSLPEEFKTGGLIVESSRTLAKAWQAPGETVRREMAERAHLGRRPVGMAPSLEKLGGDVAQVLAANKTILEDARKELQKLVPSLAERLQLLAQAAERIQEKTSSLADKAPQSEAAQVRPEARQLLENQQGIDKQIDEVMAELRRDANTQNLFTPEGREKARDADDAVAMLKQAPPKAEDLIRQAAASPETKAQEHALEKASEQQGKLAEALKLLAKHYDHAEKGKPEETRPELRKAEEALGIKKQLDAQYAQMEKLAQLSQQSAEAMKQALAEELKQNEAMKRELAQLSQEAIQRAEEKLQQAAQMEKQAAQQIQAQTQNQAQNQKGLAEQAKKIADEARQMAKQDVPQVAKEAQQAKAAQAEKPLQEAARNLEEGAQAVPQDFSQPKQAAKQLEQAAGELNQAAQDLQKAQQAAQQQAQAAQQAAQKEMAESAQAQQKSQQEAAQAQTAQQAQQAAENAEKMAQEAAKAAQAAAQQQPQNAAAQQAAQQAGQKAEQAKAQAQQAKAAAQKEAGEAQAAQQAAQAEAAQAQGAQQAAQQAQSAAKHAGEEMAQAQALAQKAQALAQQAGQQAQTQQGQMAQSAQTQQQVGQTLESAQGDIQQAAKNQETSGMAESAAALGQVAKGVEGVRQNEVPQAAQAAKGQSPQQAAQAAQKAEQAIQAQAQALAKAGQAASQAQGEPGQQESGLSEAASEFLAQALNALNAQGQQPGQPQQGQGQQGQQGSAQQAAQSAAQSQQQSMAQQRSQGGQPGQPGQGQGQQPGQMPFSQSPGSGKGAQVQSGALPEGQLPEGVMLRPGEWGKLPPRLARDLLEAQRENVSGEYRQMVETYFRVVAERAREKK